ncbi:MULTISPECIES: hypothetical protein [Sphingomonas]|uniref:Uncharacterized protein n=1 Tax=Sphingomonas kyeonggiensis TaxID=1268553 RepID=A0A7W7NUG8_9SPHN|nr:MULTISPECIES: hypothetical protein [Sphingomonas]MBB4840799.1 hypothetical protein [Sphingomonas kyeonggiensis]WHU02903.1 hypothetical protein O3305_22440 [Sphingomonas sp. NIBR02145]
MVYENEHFEGVTVTLDGNTYRNCSFKDVRLHYSGGPVEMAECGMDRFSFQFGGDLAQGLNTLYQLFGTEGMLQILRGFTEPGEGEVELRR